MNNEYQKLLSTTRALDSSVPGRNLVLESESDRARVVFSAPFRRLQQKAQVFSLEENASVRSRLTHSLEVAQVGRFLADQIVEKLLIEDKINLEQGRAFITFVEIACLMHDLGNPPFGHFGEAAIQKWFGANGESKLRIALSLKPRKDEDSIELTHQDALADFLEFDGNCQGLRIVALLQWKDHGHGLNLTYTSMAAYLKYLRAAQFEAEKTITKQFHKKAGFFQTEWPLIQKIWSHLGYTKDNPQRFPLTYVMEAADDIAYCISDLEDSIEKGLLKSQHVFPELERIWKLDIENSSIPMDENAQTIGNILSTASDSSTADASSTFLIFRTNLSRLLTDIACKEYCSNHSDILSGACKGLIKEESPGGRILEILKTFCRKNVYQHASVQRTELVGLSAIFGLLDHFGILLCCNRKKFHSALDK